MFSSVEDPEQITIQAYNEFANIWVNQHSNGDFWIDEMALFRKLLPFGKIIEIGAGGGRDAKVLIKYGYNYIGTDISPDLLAIAQRENPKANFLIKSVYDLHELGQKFDGFWASAILLHITKKNIDNALRNIHQLLRDEGFGFISIKDGNKEVIQIDEINGKRFRRFFSYWSRQDFEKTLENNGFQVVNYKYRPINKVTKWHCFFVQKTRS